MEHFSIVAPHHFLHLLKVKKIPKFENYNKVLHLDQSGEQLRCYPTTIAKQTVYLQIHGPGYILLILHLYAMTITSPYQNIKITLLVRDYIFN